MAMYSTVINISMEVTIQKHFTKYMEEKKNHLMLPHKHTTVKPVLNRTWA